MKLPRENSPPDSSNADYAALRYSRNNGIGLPLAERGPIAHSRIQTASISITLGAGLPASTHQELGWPNSSSTKIYAESFESESHLQAIVREAQEMVNKALDSSAG